VLVEVCSADLEDIERATLRPAQVLCAGHAGVDEVIGSAFDNRGRDALAGPMALGLVDQPVGQCGDGRLLAAASRRAGVAPDGEALLSKTLRRSETAATAAFRLDCADCDFQSARRRRIGAADNRDRSELAKALQAARVTGATLAIARLDRLSRNAAFLLTLRDSGLRFASCDMPAANDFTVGVMALVAEAEREAVSRPTKVAQAAARSA
jgi:hypothetical protein